MMTGILAGAAAAEAYSRQHEAFAANLANMTTPGYRRRVESFYSVIQAGAGSDGKGLMVPKPAVGIDFTPGELLPTDSALDVAISGPNAGDGNAFFAVSDDQRDVLFTRNGRLGVDGQGRLVHASSASPILSVNGSPITLNPGGGSPIIDEQGNVIQGGVNLGQIKVVRFLRPDLLRPVENGLFQAPAADPGESAQGRVEINQGYIEASNTDPITEMVKMVANFRSFEASQRVMKQMDQSLQTLIRRTSA